jgi:hypothetical protein
MLLGRKKVCHCWGAVDSARHINEENNQSNPAVSNNTWKWSRDKENGTKFFHYDEICRKIVKKLLFCQFELHFTEKSSKMPSVGVTARNLVAFW